MVSTRARWIRRVGPLVGAVCILSTAPAYASSSTAATTEHSGPVNVLYAGSLVQTMEQVIGPRFDAATGYTFTGFSAGSDALATQIKDGVHEGDVFVSASPDGEPGARGHGQRKLGLLVHHLRHRPVGHRLQPEQPIRPRSEDQALARRGRRTGVPVGSDRPGDRPQGQARSHRAATGGQARRAAGAGSTGCHQYRGVPGGDAGRATPGRAARRRILLLRRGKGGRHPDHLVEPHQAVGDLHGDRAEPCS